MENAVGVRLEQNTNKLIIFSFFYTRVGSHTFHMINFLVIYRLLKGEIKRHEKLLVNQSHKGSN